MPPEAAQAQEAPEDLSAGVDATLARGAEVQTGQDDNAPPADNDDAAKTSEEAIRVATLMGWKPKDQWKGDDSGWKPAEEFLAEVPDILAKTRQRASKTQQQLDKVAGLVAKLDANQRRQIDAQLDDELDAAIEAGDQERIRKARDAIRQNAASGSASNAAETFAERNATWYNVDPEATAYALTLDKTFSAGGISDPIKHMERIEAAVKKVYPKYFGADAEEAKPQPPRQQQRAPLVGAGGRIARQQTGEVTAATLSAKDRANADKMGVDYESWAKAVNKINKLAAQ